MVQQAAGEPLELMDVPTPAPQDDDVLVAVRACGLGLTIVWSKLARELTASRPLKLPRILGHEVAGDVVGVGRNVQEFSPGDRVVVYYYITCGWCRMCVSGCDNLCENLAGHIGRQTDGGLAEFICVPARNLRPVADAVEYVDAAVAADALATSVHVLRARARLQVGETVVVVGGGGGVGVHVVQLARAMGARPICVDIGAEKLATARQWGAELAIDAHTQAEWHEVVREYTHGHGADVVAELVTVPETVGRSLASLSPIGRMVMVGSYAPDTPLGLTAKSLAPEQAIMRSRYSTRSEVSDALDLVASGTIKMVVPTVGRLEDANAILAAIQNRRTVGRAAVVI